MKLTEKSLSVFTYVKENGGKIAVSEIAEALARDARSITASVNDLVKKGLVVREKVADGEANITYVLLTDAGNEFVQPEDEGDAE